MSNFKSFKSDVTDDEFKNESQGVYVGSFVSFNRMSRIVAKHDGVGNKPIKGVKIEDGGIVIIWDE